jgi:hypothetical protein
VQFIVDFFKMLVQSRTRSAEARVKGKIYGAQAVAKGKVSSKFNAAIDKPMNAAKEKAKGIQKGAKAKIKGQAPPKGAAPPKGQAAPSQGQGGSRQGGSKRNAPSGNGRGGFMGLFRSKQPQQVAAPVAEEVFSDDGKTQVVDVSSLSDDRGKDCVGWVVPLTGVDRGRDFRLTSGKNIIGTAADCDIVLSDKYMSSHHASIVHEKGIFTLIDLGSTNGTFVNERQCSREELIDNDTVQVGRTELKFKSLF